MDFYLSSDRAFVRDMLKIAIPMTIQQLITAGLNMIDVLMVGQLGETAIAAVGLANFTLRLTLPESLIVRTYSLPDKFRDSLSFRATARNLPTCAQDFSPLRGSK